MSWTLCTSGAAVAKAGVNANSDIIISGTGLAEFSDEVEGTICLKTRKDMVADFSGLSANFQGAVEDLASDLIAMKIINYDQSGFLKGEAQTMLDVLKDNSDTIMKDLREKQYQEKM